MMNFRMLITTGLVAGATMVQTGSADVHLQNYQAARHDRFYAGADKAFVGQAYNWSGVGNTYRTGLVEEWGTMISPSYFVSTNHWHPDNNNTLTFYEGNSTSAAQKRTYAIDWSFGGSGKGGVRVGNTDLWLGRLAAPIPASHNIKFLPVLKLPNESEYIGKEIFYVGKPNRIGRNVVTSIANYGGGVGRSLLFKYDVPGLGADETSTVTGDSGGPSFIVANGQLALVGVHAIAEASDMRNPKNGDVSGDVFIPHYINEINALMTGGEQLTVVSAVPEPSTAFALMGLTGAWLGMRRRSALSRWVTVSID